MKNFEPVQNDQISVFVGAHSHDVPPREIIRELFQMGAKKTNRRYIIAAVLNSAAKNLHTYQEVVGGVSRKTKKFRARYLWDGVAVVIRRR
jgi:hypothetical protein